MSTHHVVKPCGTSRDSVVSVVTPASSPAMKSLYPIARATAVQVNVALDGTLMALFAGDNSVVGELLQIVGLATMNVPREENVEGQLSNRASTYQITTPIGSGVLSEVVPELPTNDAVAPPAVAAQTRYELAPLTAVQANVTGELTVAPAAGEVRVGDCGFVGQAPPAAVNL